MTKVVINPSTPPEHHRFHFLDALRGLAAIVVILRHAPRDYAETLFTENSFLAVDFFFGLSGFVIAFSYERRLRDFLTFKNFFVARVIRLYPIAAMGTIIGAIELGLRMHQHGSGGGFILQIAFDTVLGLLVLPSQGYPLFPLDGVMWTLFFELIANFLYAVLVRRRLATTGLLVILASLSAIALTGERIHFGTIDLGSRLSGAYVGFTRVCLSFLLGVLTFRLYHRKRRAHFKPGASLLAAAGISLVLALVLCGPSGLTRNPAAQMVLLILVFPLIVYFGAQVALSSRWTAICAFLGTISYPIYVLHPPLLWPLEISQSIRFEQRHPQLAVPIMIVYTGGLVLLSWIAAKYYDMPIRQALTNLYKQRAAGRRVAS